MVYAMKQALETLVGLWEEGMGYPSSSHDAAIAVLRQAIDEAEQEPKHYAEIYVRIGNLHKKKYLTSDEIGYEIQTNESVGNAVLACIQKLKENIE